MLLKTVIVKGNVVLSCAYCADPSLTAARRLALTYVTRNVLLLMSIELML